MIHLSRAWFDRNWLRVVLALTACLALLAMPGCGDPPAREVPPAAIAANDLHAKADAAGIAAAEATAKGDKPAADYQAKLRVELMRLATDADHRADAEQQQIDERMAKEQAAADARSARHMAVLITVCGAVASVGLLILCWRIGLPLWIPGAVAGLAAVAAGVYVQSDAIVSLLGWSVGIAVVAAVIASGVWVIHRLRAGIGQASEHADRIEQGISTALASLDDQTRAVIKPAISEALTIAKNISGNKQISNGVHRLIQRVRGKA